MNTQSSQNAQQTENTENTRKKMQLIKELVRKNLRSPTVCCHEPPVL